MSRELDRAARQFADASSAKIADRPTEAFFSTVLTVAAGAARDGNAVVTVEWRGGSCKASSYSASYTPVVGHRVKCSVISDQIHIDGRAIGQP